MMGTLASVRIEVGDALEAIEVYYRNGWTDGLPIVPPTPERVAEFLAYAGLDPETVVATVQERGRVVTAEKIACNAVMAGCLPEYMPVLLAAVEALTAPAYNLHSATASTSGGAPLLIVSGPVIHQLDFNCRENALGPGNRANATVGRAVRLILINLLGATPGVLDKACLGHPGKYSYCIAEDEPKSPWEPLHVELGFPREASVVTVVHAEGPHHVRNQIGESPEQLLATFADTMKTCNFTGGAWVVVVNPEHRAVIDRAGWNKRDIRQFLYEQTRRTVAEMKRANRIPGSVVPADEAKLMDIVDAPESIFVIAAGGAGEFSAVIPPWAGGSMGVPVSRPILRPGETDCGCGSGACSIEQDQR